MGAGKNQQPFSVTCEQRGHATHLRVFGEIDIATVPALEGLLQAAESNGNTALVVDLKQVTFMDASGLRAFLGAAERASLSGRSFTITRAPALVRRVLQITGTMHLLAAGTLPRAPKLRLKKTPFTADSIAPGIIEQTLAQSAN